MDIIRIKINDTEVLIAPQYIRGAEWYSDFTAVEKYFTENSPMNAVVIGDLNVRIGDLQAEADDNVLNKFHANSGIRKSKDSEVNAKGRTLIEFCEDFGLIVLNGATKGDECGNFTFMNGVGESVNDICAVSHDLLGLIERFTVEEQIWSDHMPLVLNFKVRLQNTPNKTQQLLPKLHWNDNLKGQYNHKVLDNLRILKNQKDLINLEDIVNIINKSTTQNNLNKRLVAKNRWFDWQCKKARNTSFELLKEYKQHMDAESKRKYLKANENFKIVCNERKNKYYTELEVKLNKVNDSKSWWKIANEIRNKNDQELPNISSSDFKSYFMTLLNPLQNSKDIQYAHLYHEDSFLDNNITTAEIYQVLAKAKSGKAPGEDRIPYEFFKNAPHELIIEMANAYNAQYNNLQADKTFTTSVIFPIFKKGDFNQTSNYRGISFMNTIAKVLMAVITERLYNWVYQHNILSEYQAGFRREYSTIDNIYNLTTIVHLKFKEGKKVYAFFVDFKAAFDKVVRKSLIYKLHAMGVSTKMVRFIESVYNETYSTVWNGQELSEKFETASGVKQGCILSPLLFSLYINDLHDFLEGGLQVGNLNIRLLLYADDIVLISDDVNVLQKMIKKLETYCNYWNLEVNLAKSKIMVFRNGGRLAHHEKWVFNGEEIDIVNEYCYLGMILTPKCVFTKHVSKRLSSAKNCLNSTWSNFLGKKDISFQAKTHLYNAVCRSIQSYGAQIWGHSHFDEVDRLQRYFVKRVINLPKFTPNYTLFLESGMEDGHLFTLELHMRYIARTLFQYTNERLPNFLSLVALTHNISWANSLNTLGLEYYVRLSPNITQQEWNQNQTLILNSLRLKNHLNHLRGWELTESFYNKTNPTVGHLYFNGNHTQTNIMWIFKARCDLIELNGSRHSRRTNKICSLCNSKEVENIQHFIGRCPILNYFRLKWFNKIALSDEEIIRNLNGENNWQNLVQYIISALAYRKTLIFEYND